MVIKLCYGMPMRTTVVKIIITANDPTLHATHLLPLLGETRAEVPAVGWLGLSQLGCCTPAPVRIHLSTEPRNDEQLGGPYKSWTPLVLATPKFHTNTDFLLSSVEVHY